MRLALRLGLLALPLASWSAFASGLLRGPLHTPSAAGWSTWVQSDGYAIWASTMLNATIWLAVGIVALFHALPGMEWRKRFIGCALLLAGTLVFLPIMGLVGWMWPHADVATAQAIMADSMVRFWVIFATATSMTGLAILAAGMWHQDRIVASMFLVSTVAYLPTPFWLEMVGVAAGALAFTALVAAAWLGGAGPPASKQPR